MNSRLVRRAAERQEMRAEAKSAMQQPNQNLRAAAAPMPSPPEPEPVPVAPAPEVDLPEDKPESERPRPSASNAMPLVAGEERADFAELFNSLMDHYFPITRYEWLCLRELALSQWLLQRSQRAYNSIEASLHNARTDPADWRECDFSLLAMADGCRVNAERSFEKASQKVESFQRGREVRYYKDVKNDLAVRTFELEKEKFEQRHKSGRAAKRMAQAA